MGLTSVANAAHFRACVSLHELLGLRFHLLEYNDGHAEAVVKGLVCHSLKLRSTDG